MIDIFLATIFFIVMATLVLYWLLLLWLHQKKQEMYQKLKNDDIVANSSCCDRAWYYYLLLGLFVFICVIAHLFFSYEEIFTWNTPSRGGPAHTNNEWENAICLNISGYYKAPAITNNATQCSFAYPECLLDSEETAYENCCHATTCSSAFNYSTLFLNSSGNCSADMNALTKASCHPLNKYFMGTSFNISQSPSSKDHVDENNSISICYLFCQKIYDDCSTGILEMGETVAEYYNGSSDAFCKNELGVNMRYEIFTDHCFGGCPDIFNVKFTFMFVLLISTLNQMM